MTQKPPLPRPSVQQAFNVWIEANRPSLRELEKILAVKGFACSYATLSRWSREYGPWAKILVDTSTSLPPQVVIAALDQASKEARELTPEIYRGVKAQLVARLYETIKVMPFNTIDEWHRGLDCCDRIEAFIHAERGRAIAETDRTAVPRGGSRSLLATLNGDAPVVKLGDFKKPNGSNGSGH